MLGAVDTSRVDNRLTPTNEVQVDCNQNVVVRKDSTAQQNKKQQPDGEGTASSLMMSTASMHMNKERLTYPPNMYLTSPGGKTPVQQFVQDTMPCTQQGMQAPHHNHSTMAVPKKNHSISYSNHLPGSGKGYSQMASLSTTSSPVNYVPSNRYTSPIHQHPSPENPHPTSQQSSPPFPWTNHQQSARGVSMGSIPRFSPSISDWRTLPPRSNQPYHYPYAWPDIQNNAPSGLSNMPHAQVRPPNRTGSSPYSLSSSSYSSGSSYYVSATSSHSDQNLSYAPVNVSGYPPSSLPPSYSEAAGSKQRRRRSSKKSVENASASVKGNIAVPQGRGLQNAGGRDNSIQKLAPYQLQSPTDGQENSLLKRYLVGSGYRDHSKAPPPTHRIYDNSGQYANYWENFGYGSYAPNLSFTSATTNCVANQDVIYSSPLYRNDTNSASQRYPCSDSSFGPSSSFAANQGVASIGAPQQISASSNAYTLQRFPSSGFHYRSQITNDNVGQSSDRCASLNSFCHRRYLMKNSVVVTTLNERPLPPVTPPNSSLLQSSSPHCFPPIAPLESHFQSQGYDPSVNYFQSSGAYFPPGVPANPFRAMEMQSNKHVPLAEPSFLQQNSKENLVPVSITYSAQQILSREECLPYATPVGHPDRVFPEAPLHISPDTIRDEDDIGDASEGVIAPAISVHRALLCNTTLPVDDVDKLRRKRRFNQRKSKSRRYRGPSKEFMNENNLSADDISMSEEGYILLSSEREAVSRPPADTPSSQAPPSQNHSDSVSPPGVQMDCQEEDLAPAQSQLYQKYKLDNAIHQENLRIYKRKLKGFFAKMGMICSDKGISHDEVIENDGEVTRIATAIDRPNKIDKESVQHMSGMEEIRHESTLNLELNSKPDVENDLQQFSANTTARKRIRLSTCLKQISEVSSQMETESEADRVSTRRRKSHPKKLTRTHGEPEEEEDDSWGTVPGECTINTVEVPDESTSSDGKTSTNDVQNVHKTNEELTHNEMPVETPDVPELTHDDLESHASQVEQMTRPHLEQMQDPNTSISISTNTSLMLKSSSEEEPDVVEQLEDTLHCSESTAENSQHEASEELKRSNKNSSSDSKLLMTALADKSSTLLDSVDHESSPQGEASLSVNHLYQSAGGSEGTDTWTPASETSDEPVPFTRLMEELLRDLPKKTDPEPEPPKIMSPKDLKVAKDIFRNTLLSMKTQRFKPGPSVLDKKKSEEVEVTPVLPVIKPLSVKSLSKLKGNFYPEFQNNKENVSSSKEDEQFHNLLGSNKLSTVSLGDLVSSLITKFHSEMESSSTDTAPTEDFDPPRNDTSSTADEDKTRSMSCESIVNDPAGEAEFKPKSKLTKPDVLPVSGELPSGMNASQPVTIPHVGFKDLQATDAVIRNPQKTSTNATYINAVINAPVNCILSPVHVNIIPVVSCSLPIPNTPLIISGNLPAISQPVPDKSLTTLTVSRDTKNTAVTVKRHIAILRETSNTLLNSVNVNKLSKPNQAAVLSIATLPSSNARIPSSHVKVSSNSSAKGPIPKEREIPVISEWPAMKTPCARRSLFDSKKTTINATEPLYPKKANEIQSSSPTTPGISRMIVQVNTIDHTCQQIRASDMSNADIPPDHDNSCANNQYQSKGRQREESLGSILNEENLNSSSASVKTTIPSSTSPQLPSFNQSQPKSRELPEKCINWFSGHRHINPKKGAYQSTASPLFQVGKRRNSSPLEDKNKRKKVDSVADRSSTTLSYQPASETSVNANSGKPVGSTIARNIRKEPLQSCNLVNVASFSSSADSDAQSLEMTSNEGVEESCKEGGHSVHGSRDNKYYGYKNGQTTTPDSKGMKFRIRCYHCLQIFPNNVDYMEHVQSILSKANGRLLNSKQFCLQCFRTPWNRISHARRLHVKGDQYFCKICGYSFPDKVHLKTHLKDVHGGLCMPYSCSLCEYRSSVQYDLLKHFTEKHKGSRALLCVHCCTIMYCSQSFLRHFAKHYSSGNTSFSCLKCKLVFLSRAARKAHYVKDHVIFQSTMKSGTPKYKSFVFNSSSSHDSVQSGDISEQAEKILQENLTGSNFQTCLECGGEFKNLLPHLKCSHQCSKCKYNTNCGSSLAHHYITNHSSFKSPPKAHPVKKSWSGNKFKLRCRKCKFKTSGASKMAWHIATCPEGKTIVESFSYLKDKGLEDSTVTLM